MRRLSTSLPALASTALLATLAACGPVNRSSESVHIPVVTRTTLVYDIPVGSGPLSAAQAQALDDYLGGIRLRYGDRVQLSDPSAYRAAERRAAVAEVVADRGLLLEPASASAEAAPAGTIRLTVLRSKADVPECPDWSRVSQPEVASSTASNFGCATNANLAAMVADPNDLLEGKGDGAPDSTNAARAIRTYRQAKVTGDATIRNTVNNTGAAR